MPKRLYKFRTFDAEAGRPRGEFARRLILQHELWLASPKTFNDPFDSAPLAQLPADRRKQKAYFDDIIRRNMDANRQARREYAKRYIIPNSQRAHARIFSEALASEVEKLGVCSFGDDIGNILLWSHYADNHKGLSVGLKPEYFQKTHLPLEVTYLDARPTYNVIDPRKTELIEGLLVKATKWAYESEWRIVVPNKVGVFRYPRAALEAVYLGCRVEDSDRELVLSWMDDLEPEVAVYQARPAEASYTLEFDRFR